MIEPPDEGPSFAARVFMCTIWICAAIIFIELIDIAFGGR